MNIRIPNLLLLLLFVSTAFCQEKQSLGSVNANENLAFLDSIKRTFKTEKKVCQMDSLLFRELANKDLFETIETDIAQLDVDSNVDYDLSTDVLKARLKEMDAKSPFNIEWNQGLENTIKQFLKTRKKSFERLMGISEYYFPQFEEALAKENVPLEIKYLAVVESALNPRAVSKMGATGLWQFMYHTAKNYGLSIDSFTDERSDPVLASKAAATYMKNMYKIFGDWDLVLASYNSGPGNVTKAIRRAGGQQNFWKIKKYLPSETQGYVPAFLATMYIYEYHKLHGIVPKKAAVRHFETDTIMVKKELSFKQISDLLDVPVAQIQFMNPQYKTDIVPFYKNKNHFLRLPAHKIAVFTSNENKIYDYISFVADKKENNKNSNKVDKINVQQELIAKNLNDSKTNIILRIQESNITQNVVATKEPEIEFYTVQLGDNLRKIAKKFGVTEADLQLWNGLEDTNISLDSKLQILNKKAIITEINNELIAKNIEKKQQKKEIQYSVKRGDTLIRIADKFPGVTVEDLRKWNNIRNNELRPGMKLRVQG